MYLKHIQSYKYLWSTVNSDSVIEEGIQNRITLEYTANYANKFFKIKLVSKKSKLKMYWSIMVDRSGTVVKVLRY